MEKKSPPEERGPDPFQKSVAEAVEGLVYISETDAGIVPFVWGDGQSVTSEAVVHESGAASGSPVAEVDPEAFFAQLTTIKDWFGEREMSRAKKFAALYEVLRGELKDLHVFRIGSIQIDIFIVGIDPNGRLAGVMTRAVET